MTKKRYRALTGLNFPATPAAVIKLKSGHKLDPEEIMRVEAGKITDAIPPESVKHELAAGHIEEVK